MNDPIRFITGASAVEIVVILLWVVVLVAVALRYAVKK